MRILQALMLAVIAVCLASCGDDGGSGGDPTVRPTNPPVATAIPVPTIAPGDGRAMFEVLQSAEAPQESLPEELDGLPFSAAPENETLAWDASAGGEPGGVLSYSGVTAENGGVLLLILVYATPAAAQAAFAAGEYAGAAGEVVGAESIDAEFEGAPGICVSGRTPADRVLAVCAVQEGNVMIAATSSLVAFTEGRDNAVAAQETAEYGLIYSRLVLGQ